MPFTSKTFFRVSVVLLSIVGYGFFVFAAAPTGGYVPGQTNDPACAPGDVDCMVQTGWDIDPLNSVVYTTTNKIGIGTSTPVADLNVEGDFLMGANTFGYLIGAEDASLLGVPVPPNTSMIGMTSTAGITDNFYSIYLGIPGGMYNLGIQNGDFAHYFNVTGTNDGFGFNSSEDNLTINQNSSLNIRPHEITIGSSNNTNLTNSFSSFDASGISLNANGTNNGSNVYIKSDQVGMAFSTQSTQNDGNGTPLVIQVYDENSRGGGFSARSRNTSFANAGADMFVWDSALGGDRTWIWMDETKIDTGLKLDQYLAGVTNYTTNNVSEISFEFHNGNPDTTKNSKYSIATDFIWDKPASLGTIMTLNGSTGQLSLPSASFNLGGYNVVFPGSYGTAGDVLATDGSGNLSWATVASSPITIMNSNSLFSTGLNNTGSGSNAAYALFLGDSAGNGATSADNSVFIGREAGSGATSASYSNFLGTNSGLGATNATQSNFFGYNAGSGATFGTSSNFFGPSAGASANNAYYSNFIGVNAGSGATNAARSIFIGYYAGANDTVDNRFGSPSSILIGDNTSTGGFSNSIALGRQAVNTATNQFMIGSAISPIDITRINGSVATQCTITTGTGIACTSDERVKTNITDISSSVLDQVTQVRTVTYNWLGNPNGKRQIGFLAQDLEQYFPELVETDKDGMKSVYYAQMTPILVEAIRELDIKLDNLESIALLTNQSFIDRLIAWLGDATNGLTKIHVDQEVCINATCINEQDLQQFKQWQMTQGQSTTSGGSSITTPAAPTEDGTSTDSVVTDPAVLEDSQSTGSTDEEVIPTDSIGVQDSVLPTANSETSVPSQEQGSSEPASEIPTE